MLQSNTVYIEISNWLSKTGIRQIAWAVGDSDGCVFLQSRHAPKPHKSKLVQRA